MFFILGPNMDDFEKCVYLGPGRFFQRKCRGPSLDFFGLACLCFRNGWVQTWIISGNVCAWDPGRFFKENAGVQSWIFFGLACLCFRNGWVQIWIILGNMCAWDPDRFFKENAYVRSWIFFGLVCLRLEQIRRLVDFMLKCRYTVKAPMGGRPNADVG